MSIESDRGPSSDRMDTETTELKHRAFAGVTVLLSWNYASLFVAFLGNLVLARLLTPRDFGLVAIGATVMLVTTALTEGGLGSGLIQRPGRPTEAELRTLTGVQLALATFATAVIVAVAVPWGTIGQVTALMVTALPISALQIPGRVVLIRSVRVRSQATVDASALLAQYVWSISTVLLGMGVWGFASGTVARAVVGTAVMAAIPGAGLRRPSFERIRDFGELASFGARFQGVWIVVVVREQLVNVVTGVSGGIGTLGLWSLANRLMQVPYAPVEALIRVTFPTMSHLLAQKRETRPLVERFARVTAVGSAIILSAFVGSAPGLVPALFGDDWSGLVPALPGACLGLMIAAPLRTATSGYLFAADRPNTVLWSSIIYGVALVAVTAALLPLVGIAAIGLAWVAGAVGEGIVVAREVRRLSDARVVVQIIRPLLAAVLGGTAGWLAANEIGNDLVAGVAGGSVAFLVTLAVLFAISRRSLAEFFRTSKQSVRHALGRENVPRPVVIE